MGRSVDAFLGGGGRGDGCGTKMEGMMEGTPRHIVCLQREQLAPRLRAGVLQLWLAR